MVNMRSLCVLIATCGAALGDIVVSRTVEKFPGTASAVIEGDACGTNDQWGSNNCDLDWSSTYVADLSIATGTDIVEGSTITIDAVVEAIVPFKATCAACGAPCTLTVPVIKKQYTFDMPPCPISGATLRKSLNFTLPQSEVPLKIGFHGSVTLADPSGATLAVISAKGDVSPKARAKIFRAQARQYLGLDLGDSCDADQCSGVDCGIAIASCAAACATSFPAGCVSCIGAYPSCCRCASYHFGFDCSYC